MEVTIYFFDSGESSSLVPRVVVAEQPLEALEVDFGQSFAIWPPALQNMQSLLSKRHFCSLEVSLPSLPSFDMRSGLRVEEEVVEVFPLTSGEALEPPEFMEDVAGVCMEWGWEWKLIAGEASPSEYSLMHAPRVGDSGQALEAEAEVACH